MEARTDAQLGPLGRIVIDRLSPQPGDRVLDVGCGAGQTLLDLAERVGPGGRVVGVDVSDPLVERARERIAQAGVSHAEVVLDNAATARFDRPFDLVFSRFGVMFFQDSVAAFRNLLAALRPGGRLGFVSWQAMDKNAWATVPLAAVRGVAPELPLPELFQPGGPGPFNLSDPVAVRSILEGAGFSQVEVEPREVELVVGGEGTLDDAVDFTLQIGPAARFAAQADPALLPGFRQALSDALSPFATERGIVFVAHILVVTAERR
jgi:SAM-dependent methyltransferase